MQIRFGFLFCFMATCAPLALRSEVRSLVLENNENKDIYFELSGADVKPNLNVFSLALKGYEKLNAEKLLDKDSILTIVDMSMPSTKSRFWTINLKQKKIIAHSLVAHGKNTGENMASVFSNTNGSHQTSLGFYKTGGTYIGKHGYSMYLHGLEDEINDKALERNIVVHGANYVSQEFIKKYGRLGRSFGCPALPDDKAKDIIDVIKDGTCLFIYFPKQTYLESSALLNS